MVGWSDRNTTTSASSCLSSPGSFGPGPPGDSLRPAATPVAYSFQEHVSYQRLWSTSSRSIVLKAQVPRKCGSKTQSPREQFRCDRACLEPIELQRDTDLVVVLQLRTTHPLRVKLRPRPPAAGSELASIFFPRICGKHCKLRPQCTSRRTQCRHDGIGNIVRI